MKYYILAFIFLALPLQYIQAVPSVSDLRNIIESHADTISLLEKEIAQYQKELNVISGQSQTLASAVAGLDLSRKKLLAQIKLSEREISNKTTEIRQLEGRIGEKNDEISVNQAAIAKSIRSIREFDTISTFSKLFLQENFSDVWSAIEELRQFQTTLKENTNELTEIKEILYITKSDVEDKRTELKLLNSELSDQKKVLDIERQSKNTLLSETKNKESNYKELIANKEALKKQFENELFQYESQLKFVLDPDSIPVPGSAPLSWPLEHIYVTQNFGKTVDSARLYLSGTHSGTDFRGSVGTPVFAMGSGTVVASGDTDTACRGASFGKWIFIKYDNGLASTYGHLSLIRAKDGQRVNRGDIVAYSGNTGHSTGPHLHVSLYVASAVEISGKESNACKGKILIQPRAATNAYLDPLDYMPQTTPSMFKAGA